MGRISISILLGCALCAGFAGTARTDDHEDGAIVIDQLARAVVWIPPLTSDQELLWSGDPLDEPTDAILEPDGTLLIIDQGAKALFRFDPTAGTAPTLVGSFRPDSCWVARLNDTELLLSGPDGLTHFDLATGAVTPLPTELVDPFDVTVGSDGRIFVADPGASALISVDPVNFEGTPFSTPLDSCWIAVAPDSQVATAGPDGVHLDGQIVTAGPDGVFLVPAFGGAPIPVSSGGMFVDPTAVVLGGYGEVFVADRGARAVFRVDLHTGAQSLITSDGFLQEPVGLLLIPSPAVPALSSPGQVLLTALLLVGAGSALLWTRRRTARPPL